MKPEDRYKEVNHLISKGMTKQEISARSNFLVSNLTSGITVADYLRMSLLLGAVTWQNDVLVFTPRMIELLSAK